MSRLSKLTLPSLLILVSLACGLISNPINQAKDLASTAEAIASSVPTGIPSGIPNIPGVPNVGDYLNPTGQPVSEWKDIPIMTQASAGQEFNANTYSFKASGVTAADVQTFYNEKLKALGWSSAFSFQGGEQGGLLLFTKDSQALSITVTTDENQNVIVILLLQ